MTPQLRRDLLVWVWTLIRAYEAHPRTFFVAANIMDAHVRFSESPQFTTLLAATCLWIATKLEEVCYISSADLVCATKSSFSIDDMIAMERSILRSSDGLMLTRNLPSTKFWNKNSRCFREFSAVLLCLNNDDYTSRPRVSALARDLRKTRGRKSLRGPSTSSDKDTAAERRINALRLFYENGHSLNDTSRR